MQKEGLSDEHGKKDLPEEMQSEGKASANDVSNASGTKSANNESAKLVAED